MLAEAEDQAHVIEGIDRVARALGGVTNVWRFDRMATVCHPATGAVTGSFAAVAKHYGVSVAICPPRRGNRKGVVEKANHTAAQAWWRTLAEDVTIEQAQASLERFCDRKSDLRRRVIDGVRDSVAGHAARERLRPIPTGPFPATISVQRQVSAQALVSFRGNRYSVPPELAHAAITVTRRLNTAHIDIAAAGGIVVARHHLAADGAGVMVRDHGHVIALEAAAMAAFTTAAPHRRKQRIPPGVAALAAAAEITNTHPTPGEGVIIDLNVYAQAAQRRNTLP